MSSSAATAHQYATPGDEGGVGKTTPGLPPAEVGARRRGYRRMAPLGISRKVWHEDALSVPLRSITSPDREKRIYLRPRLLPLRQERRVAVIDDELSSGAAIAAVPDLLRRAGASPVAVGAAMAQGTGWRQRTEARSMVHAIARPIRHRSETGWSPA